MSALSLSLPRAERTISLFALLVAPALAALAAFSPRLAIYVLAAAIGVFIVFRSLLAGLALFIVLTFPDQLPGALDVGPTLAKPLGIVILISWLLTIVGDRERQKEAGRDHHAKLDEQRVGTNAAIAVQVCELHERPERTNLPRENENEMSAKAG